MFPSLLLSSKSTISKEKLVVKLDQNFFFFFLLAMSSEPDLRRDFETPLLEGNTERDQYFPQDTDRTKIIARQENIKFSNPSKSKAIF